MGPIRRLVLSALEWQRFPSSFSQAELSTSFSFHAWAASSAHFGIPHPQACWQHSTRLKSYAACVQAANRYKSTKPESGYYSHLENPDVSEKVSVEKCTETSSGSESLSSSAGFQGAAGASVLGAAGMFGKRAVLFLGGKKAILGLFTVTPSPTGRNRVIILSKNQEAQLSERAISELLNNRKYSWLPPESPEYTRVDNIVNSFSRVVAQEFPEEAKDWMSLVMKDTSGLCQAYSLPPSFLIFSQGIINKCSNDDELAFIIGHEMGHIISRHAIESMSRNNLLVVMFTFLEEWMGIRVEANALQLWLRLPLSRDQEHEADLIGVTLMQLAGRDANAAVQLLEKLSSVEGMQLLSESWTAHWSTHPSFRDRITKLKNHIENSESAAVLTLDGGTTT